MNRYLPDQKERHYVGLPANQIGMIIPQVATVTSCERDNELCKWQRRYISRFSLKGPSVLVTRTDILDLLQKSPTRWNLFDLDLMCFARKPLIQSIAAGLSTSCREGTSVLNLTTAIGRKITKQEYKELMPEELFRELKKHNLTVIDHVSGYYRDRVIPMAYELVVFKK